MNVVGMRRAAPAMNLIRKRAGRFGGLMAALLVSTALTAPAFADGAASGFGYNGDGTFTSNPGGSDQATSPGSMGTGAGGNHVAGGGGGGAGSTGGDGGASERGPMAGVRGGLGGATPGARGGDGGTDIDGSGSGGGGGAHGYVGSTLPVSAVAGGNGGRGGDTGAMGTSLVAAGGGGAGGYGAVVTGDGSLLNGTLSVAVVGGNGGSGGNGLNNASQSGGGGGSGGIGLLFTPNNGANPASFTFNGPVTGGNGGAAGSFGIASGDGGIGLSIATNASAQTQFAINSAIKGGKGGAGGYFSMHAGNGGTGLSFLNSSAGPAQVTINAAVSGGDAGAPGALSGFGAGGAGLVGSNITVIMGSGGSITGGSSSLVGQANAIEFINGGTNFLVFNGATSQLSGGIRFNNDGGSSALALVTDVTTVVDNAITGSGGIGLIGSGTIVLTGANTYTQGTYILNGTLKLSGAGTLGDVGGETTIKPGATLDLGGTTQTQSAVTLDGGTIQSGSLNAPVSSTGGTIKDLGGTASLTTTGGVTTLLGTLGYTGATTVNGGTLDVEGTITGTTSVTVNSGGTLTGSGIIDPPFVTINSGGTFAPGNGTPGSSTGIVGDLAFQSGAIYLVQVNPATASFASVTGAATLGGATVNAVFAGGSYISKTYTILTATGGVSGTFASNVVNTNLPANFHTGLRYDANNAYLDLALNYTPPTTPDFGAGLPRNQQAVASALINSFNANGGIPLVYGLLTQVGLTQASGELGTSSQQTTFQAMGQFMGMLTGPASGCASQAQGGDACFNGASGSGVLGYANEQPARKHTGDAFAMFTKAPAATSADPRWSIWVMGFGGSQTTDGNAAVGSNSATSSLYGTAVGADYRLSPNTIAGFALAGGGTNFSVGNGGSGRSDLFQAGAYVRHNIGAAYLSAALGYGWQDITTDRSVMADRLRASFNANAWSGRAEGGYRLIAPWVGGIGITPYAAVQVTTFDLPAYAEQVLSGSSAFALNYAGKSITDTRTELGLRTDKSFVVQDGILTLRSRFAWAHDYNSDRSVAATFQALPGASFVVNGAAQARDAALTTASAEMKWRNGWSAAATFEGEFSNVTRSYGGRGVVRYSW